MGRSLATVCVTLLGATIALGQVETPPADLRRENDLLRQRVDQLEAQLAELRRDIDELRAVNNALRSQIDSLSKAPAPDTPDSAPAADPTPSEPSPPPPLLEQPRFSSIESLRAHLEAEYAATFADRVFTGRDRQPYLRDVRDWTRTIATSWRSEIEWIIELDPATLADDTMGGLRFWVLEPDLGRRRQESPTTHVFSERVVRGFLLNAEQLDWVILGEVRVSPVFNRDRDTQGAIDFPPFVGPFVEFDYRLTIRTITRYTRP